MPTDRETRCMKCAACCKPTEMLVSPSDVERMRARGYDIDACTIPSGQFPWLRVLKSIGGRCYFLEGPGREDGMYSCALYPDHPAGCKFYPLIYDVDRGTCIIEKKYCKQWRDFKFMADDEACCQELERVLRDEMHVI
ncbi:MAG TPA: YkgJ family cysteine cluster protein [Candidatus Lokiarchaeia archaeon]|nr:YkgJ family cysteine cluster protein [Candidatus Lokiarchaeia archaeon]